MSGMGATLPSNGTATFRPDQPDEVVDAGAGGWPTIRFRFQSFIELPAASTASTPERRKIGVEAAALVTRPSTVPLPLGQEPAMFASTRGESCRGRTRSLER